MQGVAHTCNVARLQHACVYDDYMTAWYGVVAKLDCYLLALYCRYRLLPVNLVAVYTPVSSCSGIFRSIVHHIRHTVQGFSFNSFRFLTLGTKSFLLCSAESCGFISCPSAFSLYSLFPAVGCPCNLLPYFNLLTGCIDSCLALPFSGNLLRNGNSAFRFGFLNFIQFSFFVSYHCICNILRHSLITFCLLDNGIPCGIGVNLFIDGLSLFVFRYAVKRRILHVTLQGFACGVVMIICFGSLRSFSICRRIHTGTLVCRTIVFNKHVVKFLSGET